MSNGYTEEWLRDYQAKHRGLKIEILSVEPKSTNVRIDREVKHDYKAEFEQQLSLVGIQVEHEFYFARPRKWRADWKVKDCNVLIEYEGGLFAENKIGHGNAGGILRDIAKYNEAALKGYTVIRITSSHVVSGQALQWVEQAVAQTSRHSTET